MAVDGDIGCSGIVRRRFDQADAAPLRHIFRCDVGPIFSAIARDVNHPIIGAGPDKALCNRGFSDRENGVVVLGAGIINIDRSTGGLLLALVVAGEIGADRFPVHSAIGALEKNFAGVIQSIGIVR